MLWVTGVRSVIKATGVLCQHGPCHDSGLIRGTLLLFCAHTITTITNHKSIPDDSGSPQNTFHNIFYFHCQHF